MSLHLEVTSEERLGRDGGPALLICGEVQARERRESVQRPWGRSEVG